MKPLILITNDDGIFSPGLKAAAEAVQDISDILIVAPVTQQTGMSRSISKAPNVGIIETVKLDINGKETKAFGVQGSPSQAVVYALSDIIPNRIPSLCISGVNYGENVGSNITMSGTIGAAFEASSFNIPSLAVSLEYPIEKTQLEEYTQINWEVAKYFTRLIAQKILSRGLPPEVALLNVNIPSDANTNTLMKFTIQSRQSYFVFEGNGRRDFSKPFPLRANIKIDKETLEPESDIQALWYDRLISITPITSNLTANINIPKWSTSFIN